MSLGLVILLGLSVVFVVILLRSVHRVAPGQAAIVERLGTYSHTLQPGTHLLVPVVDHVKSMIDLGEHATTVSGTKVATSDGHEVTVDATVRYRVADPVRATYEVASLLEAIQLLLVEQLRTVFAARPHADVVVGSVSEVAGGVRAPLAGVLAPLGVELLGLEVGPANR